MLSFGQIWSQMQSQMQFQGLVLPPKPEVGPFVAPVNTKGSSIDPSGQDPYTDESDKCGFYVDGIHPRLVALGKVYEGSTIIHNIPLGNHQVKVGVEEV